jgi:hypothetical protein
MGDFNWLWCWFFSLFSNFHWIYARHKLLFWYECSECWMKIGEILKIYDGRWCSRLVRAEGLAEGESKSKWFAFDRYFKQWCWLEWFRSSICMREWSERETTRDTNRCVRDGQTFVTETICLNFLVRGFHKENLLFGFWAWIMQL